MYNGAVKRDRAKYQKLGREGVKVFVQILKFQSQSPWKMH
jgi:hypothetical protein